MERNKSVDNAVKGWVLFLGCVKFQISIIYYSTCVKLYHRSHQTVLVLFSSRRMKRPNYSCWHKKKKGSISVIKQVWDDH